MAPFNANHRNQTCTTLYEIAKDRDFWIYYIKRLCAQYNPILPKTFASMSFKLLRRMASTPYRLENALAEGKLDKAAPISWKFTSNIELCGAKLVPGGHWLVTLGEEWMQHRVICRSVIRIWRVRFDNSAQPLAPVCIHQMPSNWIPVELQVDRGEGPHEILILFNAIDRNNPLDGRYALRRSLS